MRVKLDMIDLENFFDTYLRQQMDCLKKFNEQNHIITKIVNSLIDARDNNKKIFVIGNGGSSSTSSHFTSDLLKTAITAGSKRFQAISLTENIAVISAWANDTNYDNIFSEQLTNYLTQNDLVIAFSGSGNSLNIINAINYAKEKGSLTIGFTGTPGGKLSQITDICFKIPSSDMLTIETFHLMLCHLITSCIRNMGEPVFKYE